MSAELLAYPVFEHALHEANGVLRDLGCPWSVLGEYPFLCENGSNGVDTDGRQMKYLSRT